MPTLTPVSFRKMRLVWTVEYGGSASAEIDLREDQMSDDWMSTNRLVITGPRGWGGNITEIARTGGPDGEYKVGYKVSALGFVHRLDKRIVRHDFAVNDEASVIVEALLSEAQDNQFNGDMGFTFGSVVGTTVSKQRGYCVGIVIGDAIRELASIGNRGFDWEIDPDGVLNIWAGTRGINTGKTLAETDVSRWEPTLDTSELLTNVTALSDPSDPYNKFRMSRTAMADNYGRHEATIDTDIVALNEENPDWEDELYDAGRSLLKVQGGAFLNLRVMYWSHKAPWNLGDVWLQDRITAVLPSWFGGNQTVRCTEVAVTLDPLAPMQPNGLPPYVVEQSFDALVEDFDITDGDPDQES